MDKARANCIHKCSWPVLKWFVENCFKIRNSTSFRKNNSLSFMQNTEFFENFSDQFV